MKRIMTLLSLSPGDQFRLFSAALLLLIVPAAIGVLPFSRVRYALLRSAALATPIVPGAPGPTRLTWAVSVADHHLPGSRSCLVRSLASEALLRLYGHTPAHRIGVDPDADDGFMAHSWLEYEGDVLIGDVEQLSQYEALPPLDDP
jgi:hypothetical protein